MDREALEDFRGAALRLRSLPAEVVPETICTLTPGVPNNNSQRLPMGQELESLPSSGALSVVLLD